jgi:KaiC/GvpD/RAD55 family RecA-like ATPase
VEAAVMPAPSVPALVTCWRSYLDISGTSVDTTWVDFFAYMRKPRPYQGDREHPGWSPCRCEPPLRKDENVQALSALVLDCDGGGSIEGAREIWAPFYGFIHTTRKHSEASHRYRIVLPLSRHVTPAEHAKLWSWANARAVRAGHRLDAATRNVSRFWYEPGTTDGPFESHDLEGQPIDVDAVLAELARQDGPPSVAPAPRETSILVRIRRASHYIGKMDPAISGSGGHAQTWKVALVLTRGFDLSDDVALDLLEREYNPRCQPPWSRRQLEHKIKTARRDGRVPTGYLLEDDATEWHTRTVAPPAPEAANDDDVERESIREESAPESGVRWKTPPDRALGLGHSGVLLPSGYKTLDTAMRGGFRTGKVVALGGAPGAGKTTFAVNMALGWALQGVHVAILAADEDADGLLIRMGQLFGFGREDLENGVQETKEGLSERLRLMAPTLMLVDAEEHQATVENVSAELKRQANGATSVLIIDSIQTVRTTHSPSADTPRARVDAVMSALKRCSKVDGHLVMATCELARGAYRKADERIDDLASFKESGGIEYGVHVAVVLRSLTDEEGTVEATMPKNRLGQKLPFRLELDYRRARFAEAEIPDEDEDEEMKKFEAMCDRVCRVLRKHTDLTSASAVAAYCGRKTAALQAVKHLTERGRIQTVNGSLRLV